jgi:hypothetical protein
MDTGDGMTNDHRLFQPPDAENRTSGGVEGSRGAIPANPSDPAALNPEPASDGQHGIVAFVLAGHQTGRAGMVPPDAVDDETIEVFARGQR